MPVSYRDDRNALRERIELLEKRAARTVSPEELATLRKELVDAKDRLEGERQALDVLLGRLDSKAPAKKKGIPILIATGVLASVVLVLSSAATWALLARSSTDSPAPHYEGAPDAVRARPPRREIDREVARLMPDLDGCMPEGDDARIQIEIVFEGRHGAIREVIPRNVSLHDSYPTTTPECLEGVLHGVGAAPFRAPSYRYHLTLEWSEGRLQPPPLWERYDLL